MRFEVFHCSITRRIIFHNDFHWRFQVAKASQTAVVPFLSVIGYYYGEYLLHIFKKNHFYLKITHFTREIQYLIDFFIS